MKNHYQCYAVLSILATSVTHILVKDPSMAQPEMDCYRDKMAATNCHSISALQSIIKAQIEEVTEILEHMPHKSCFDENHQPS